MISLLTHLSFRRALPVMLMEGTWSLASLAGGKPAVNSGVSYEVTSFMTVTVAVVLTVPISHVLGRKSLYSCGICKHGQFDINGFVESLFTTKKTRRPLDKALFCTAITLKQVEI